MTCEGAHGLKKRIERTAYRLFLWSEHRGLKFIKSVKNEPRNVSLFVSSHIFFGVTDP